MTPPQGGHRIGRAGPAPEPSARLSAPPPPAGPLRIDLTGPLEALADIERRERELNSLRRELSGARLMLCALAARSGGQVFVSEAEMREVGGGLLIAAYDASASGWRLAVDTR